MFQYFFSEYKSRIFKGSTLKEGVKKLSSYPKKGLGMLLLFFLFYAGVIVAFCLGKIVLSAILLLPLMVDAVSMHFWYNDYSDKVRDACIEAYKQETLQPLIDLLQNSKFSFYSVKKVEWLISCCEAELQGGKSPFRNMPDSFFKWVFPIITLFFGTQMNSHAPSTVAAVLVVVFFVWITAFLMKPLASRLMDYLSCPDKKALLFLKSELNYIRLLLDDPVTNAIDSKSARDDSEQSSAMVAQAGT